MYNFRYYLIVINFIGINLSVFGSIVYVYEQYQQSMNADNAYVNNREMLCRCCGVARTQFIPLKESPVDEESEISSCNTVVAET